MSNVSLNLHPMQKYQQAVGADKSADKGQASETTGKSFGEMFSDSIKEANNIQASADTSMASFLSGESNGLHKTMLALEKADISMRLMVQVRNKAVEAYREVMRMQV